MTQDFREQVREALIQNRVNFKQISDAKYAKMYSISSAVYSRIKAGETERVLADSRWIEIGRKLNVNNKVRKWNIARTAIYNEIEQNIKFCKNYSKATILIDENAIGKSFCTKHIIQSLPNSYYIDCSQARSKSQFIRHLAKTLGVDDTGKLYDIKENLKYYINLIDLPFIALDDAGYLELNVIVEIIELWNASEGNCGWLMIGDDSLQNKIQRGLNSKKVGFKALFSRFSDEFIHYVPVAKQDKQNFYKQLIGDVASVNISDKSKINKLVKLCISKEKKLRHLLTLIQLENAYE